MARGGGYTAQTAAAEKAKSLREAIADQTYGFGTKAGNAIKADVVMAQREATAAAQAPDARNPLAAFEARQRLAAVEATPTLGVGPSWEAIIEKRIAEKAPPEQAGPPVPSPLRRNTAEIPAAPAAKAAPVEAAPAAKVAPVEAAPAAKVASTAKTPATPAAPAAGRDINALFAKATGTAFDPKSRMDIAKKQELEALLKGSPDLAGKSDTQVALQYYRQMANSKRK